MQGDRVRLAIGRTIPSRLLDISRLLRLQTGGQGAIASGIRRRYSTAPTRMRRARRGSIVKAAVLYTNWLAPGFNIDSRERVYSEHQSPNCPIKLSCLGFQSERERNSCLPTIPIAVLQKPLICKKCSNSTLVRLFDMACYATGVLIRRIQEVSEYKKSIKKQRNLI